ncbi:hypothetical protein XENOCAPTIV_004105, partial [Xenoophorus captivus]
LLHTLHWMLLDAAQECNHEPILSQGWSQGGSSSSAFLQPVGNQGSSPGAPGSGSESALGGSGPQHSSSLLEDDEHARTKLFHKSMATVELFVFLFSPLIHRIKESDLTFRLASGLVIWQPMWEHRQPDIPAFTSLIKPVRNIVTGKYKYLLEFSFYLFMIRIIGSVLSRQQRGIPQSTTSVAPADLPTKVPW